MNDHNAYNLLDWATTLGFERKLPVNLNSLCSLLDVEIIESDYEYLGGLKVVESSKIQFHICNGVSYFDKRFIVAMLIGHLWMNQIIAKAVDDTEHDRCIIQVNEIVYPKMTLSLNYELTAISLFAAQLLMPEYAVRNRVSKREDESDYFYTIKSLAKEFEVPRGVMAQRLKSIEDLDINSLLIKSSIMTRLENVFF